MENPAVEVIVTITRPDAQTPLWTSTQQGAEKYAQMVSVLQSYGTDIEVSRVDSPDGLTRTQTIQYRTQQVYNDSRAKALALIPDFIALRDAYYASVGGTVDQQVVTH